MRASAPFNNLRTTMCPSTARSSRRAMALIRRAVGGMTERRTKMFHHMGVDPSDVAPQLMTLLGDDGKVTGTNTVELADAANGAERLIGAPFTTALTTTVPACAVGAELRTVTYTTLALVEYPTTFNPKLTAPN